MLKDLVALWTNNPNHKDWSNYSELTQSDLNLWGQSIIMGEFFLLDRLEYLSEEFGLIQENNGEIVEWKDNENNLIAIWCLDLKINKSNSIIKLKELSERIYREKIPISHYIQFNKYQSGEDRLIYNLYCMSKYCYLSHKLDFIAGNLNSSISDLQNGLNTTISNIYINPSFELFKFLKDSENQKFTKILQLFFDKMAKKMAKYIGKYKYRQEVDDERLWLWWSIPNKEKKEIFTIINDGSNIETCKTIIELCEEIENRYASNAFIVVNREDACINPEKTQIFDMFCINTEQGLTFVNRFSNK